MRKPLVTIKDAYRTIKTNGPRELYRHLTDSTAFPAFFTPIGATLEHVVGGIDTDISLHSRAKMIALSYLGLSYVGKVRDWLKPRFGIDEESSERAHKLFDRGFGLTFAATVFPTVYVASGERDIGKIALSTALIAGASIVTAAPAFKFVDVFRELTGYKESKRTPELIKRQHPYTKRALVVAVVGLSAALTLGVEYGVPNRSQIIPESTHNEHPDTVRETSNSERAP